MTGKGWFSASELRLFKVREVADILVPVTECLLVKYAPLLMSAPIHHMTVIRYFRDGRPWESEKIPAPMWSDVEAAIRRMDNYCFPIVQLNTTENEESPDVFWICGGDQRWALFQIMGDWQYEKPGGGEGEVQLWESDQGYYCREKNILTDVEQVLHITKAFYDTGSYDGLDSVS